MALAPARVEERLRERFPDASIERQTGEAVRDHTLFVPAARLVEMATFLRDVCRDFSCCSRVVRKAAGQEKTRFFNVFKTNSVANRSALSSAREDRSFVY